MHVLFAFDTYKGSLNSLEAADSARIGALRIFPKLRSTTMQLADGGEGTLAAFLQALGGSLHQCPAVDALCRPLQSDYLLLPDGSILLESATCLGLPLLKHAERNPEKTSSYGLGLMLKNLVDLGHRDFIISLGGSATCDGGLGMLAALGAALLDQYGKSVQPNGRGLYDLHSINLAGISESYLNINLKAAVDVDNPMLGPTGTAPIFAPQKGADQAMVARLDQGLQNFTACLQKVGTRQNVGSIMGGGAAGGLGALLATIWGATLQNGFKLLADIRGLEAELSGFDLVITGEGRLDLQSLAGKGPMGLAALCKQATVPCIALCGQIDLDQTAYRDAGLAAAFSICHAPISETKSMQSNYAKLALQNLSESVFSLIHSFK